MDINNPYLNARYQEQVANKWAKVLDAGNKVVGDYKRIATAMVLESTQKLSKQKMINEDIGVGGQGFATGDTLGMLSPEATGDARVPTIVIPTVRRIFPELLAHETVGVQPMSGPIGYAFALRFVYGKNRAGVAGSASGEGIEIGYNSMLSDFTGAEGAGIPAPSAGLNTAIGTWVDADAPTTAELGALTSAELAEYGTYDAYKAFTGATNTQILASTTTTTNLVGGQVNPWGVGAEVADAETWGVGTDMPEVTFDMKKGGVEAKTRKTGAGFSLETAEDMKNMHGLDIESELINTSSYEIQAQIDRQLLKEMVKASISLGRTSSWSPVEADGRNQLERIATLHTHMLIRSNMIARYTRRGSANFGIASPDVSALLERVGDVAFDTVGEVNVDTAGDIGVSKVGTLRHGNIKLYRDVQAQGDYVLLGYKGKTPYDAGIVYCPYIPVQVMKAQDPNTFAPRIGIRTRYGVLNHQFGAGNYYQFISVNDLRNTAGLADGSRVFLR